MTALDYLVIQPEAALALYALLALLFGAYFGKDAVARPLLWLTVVVFVGLSYWIGVRDFAASSAFGGMVRDDAFARFAQIGSLLGAAAVLAMSADHLARRDMLRFEFPVLVTLAVVGMMVMVAAGDLLSLYMGLELQSLALYVIASARRGDVRSSEAGLKYFVLGALSSGLLLYGSSLIYGFAGTTSFAGILQGVQGGALSVGLLFGLVFVIAGLAFKVSAAPFHMWTPDVYEGAPTPVTAFFATAPKMAAMALFARVLFDAFGHVPGDWGQIVAALAVLSMLIGSIAGIGQRDIKRLMAYSSIAHMGFALIGLAAGTVLGVQAMLVYMAIYVTMNVGTFAFILGMERDGVPVSDLASLNLLSKSQPMKALALQVLLWSMAGVPPLLGFWAKFGVLNAAVEAGMGWLAILGVIASVIGAFYYLRLIYFMYFGAEDGRLSLRMSAPQSLLLAVSALVMVVGAVTLFGVDKAAGIAAESLVTPVVTDAR